jgi:hypothetical protein
MAYLSQLSTVRIHCLLSFAVFLLLLAGASPLAADACAPLLSGVTSATRMGNIALTGVSGGGSVNSSAISGASGNWGSECSGYDNPSFGGSGSGGMAVNVIFYAGTDADNSFSCNGKCACTDTQITSGRVSGATVRMFEEQGNGVSCTGSQTDILTHELGHVLGLGDSSCSGRIMGDVFGSIESGDCTAVDGNFLTPEEIDNPDPGDGQGPCGV